MRIMLLALVLSACVPVEPETPAPTPEDTCGAARVTDLLGQMRSDSMVVEVQRRSVAPQIRWIRPGDVVTMDYSAERLNVHLDQRDRIQRFACG